VGRSSQDCCICAEQKSPLYTWEKNTKEMFTREKLEVNHLRMFGCLVYVHVPNDKRLKLDPSGKKGIFVGYSETSKAYRVYIPGH
jgi:hypothetical protein